MRMNRREMQMHNYIESTRQRSKRSDVNDTRSVYTSTELKGSYLIANILKLSRRDYQQ